ncbi:MAG: myo-inositol-1(or 4)-monophosphatase [Bacteriovoracaceae bacterium]|jgi:myo-inositol-1(or 4)-monophosphatase
MTNTELEKLCSISSDIAHKAKEYIQLNSKSINVLSDKGRDIKINLDRESNELIKNLLLKETDYSVLTEESGFHKNDNDLGSSPYWIVDPIDGTFNFSRGIPHCCISIALWKKDEPMIGIILDLNSSDFYIGSSSGTFLNGEKFFVSHTSDCSQSVLCTGFPVDLGLNESSSLALFLQFEKFKKIRMLGSAATSLAYLASGKVDAYIEKQIRIWDVAAGLALVKFAGGKVEFKRVENDPTLLDVVATNGRIKVI